MTPYFDSFSAFLHMGGHGAYVWACYALVFGCVAGLIWFAKHERKATIAKLTQQNTRLTNKQRNQRSKL